jgi:hypothetical protein
MPGAAPGCYGRRALSAPARVLLLAQLGFVAFLALCAAIDPSGLEDNHGWSYYEGRGDTVVPYLLAFGTFIALVLYATTLLQGSSAPAGFVAGLRLLPLFLILNLATPDTVNAFFYWAHDVTSALLFLYELGFAIWVVAVMAPSRLGVGLLVAQFAGGLVAMFSQLHAVSLLGFGILVFQLCFGLLLVAAAAPVRVGEAAVAEEATAPANR